MDVRCIFLPAFLLSVGFSCISSAQEKAESSDRAVSVDALREELDKSIEYLQSAAALSKYYRSRIVSDTEILFQSNSGKYWFTIDGIIVDETPANSSN